jgi:signal transduction histidine kinase
VHKRHRVTIKTTLEEDTHIRFDIEDNGVGMTDEIRSKLFTSFFSTKGVKGTGLGLLVTRKLIEEHNGTVDVSSTPGKGTVFTVRIPMHDDTQ